MAKVLALVSFKVFPARMGGQKSVVSFYDHLSRFHEVTLAVSTDNQVPADRSYKVIPLLYNNRKMPLNVFRIPGLTAFVKQGKYDCIIAEHSFTGWLAARVAKACGLPFIIHNHNIESLRFRQMGRWWWHIYELHEKDIFKKATHLFFISDEDRSYALSTMGVSAAACSVVTYGADQVTQDRDAGKQLRQRLGVGDHKAILYFNGTLDYHPNTWAVENLMERLLPRLDAAGFRYHLVVSGSRCPENLRRQMAMHPQVRYVEYVEPLNLFYSGCDVFLNPVTNDAGVKTKLVEALACSAKVVSMQSGAAGIRKELARTNLEIVADGDWKAFAANLVELAARPVQEISKEFLEYHSWQRITSEAATIIQKISVS